MRTRVPAVRLACLALISAVLLMAVPSHAGPKPFKSKLKWALRLGKFCESPRTFYSPQHIAGRKPCCPAVEGMCPGGLACPPSGLCVDGSACQPGAVEPRPNIVLVIGDDQGDCHYGTAGECRSQATGVPTPVPSTPNLDILAGYGTTFPVAHNTSAWCFPSLISALTGRYQRSFTTNHKIGNYYPTIPKTLRSLGDSPSAPNDPFNSGNKIGGYCTFLGGKFPASTGDDGFDATARGRKLGRTTCGNQLVGGVPQCGTDAATAYSPSTLQNMADLFEFVDSMFHQVPGTNPAVFNVQRFFAWYGPRLPHQPLRAPQAIRTYLFGPSPGLTGLFDLGQYCTSGGGCAPVVPAFEEGSFGKLQDFYANMWWADDGLREIRKYLARASEPHCIGANGLGQYDVQNPGGCGGTWAQAVTPNLAENTVLIYFADNGWFLPNSKHAYSENGYRTRVIVFDPRTLPQVPDWNPANVTPPPARETPALVHSSDFLPTILGYALDTPGQQACPVSSHDNTACDGKDIRPWLLDAPGGPAAPETLRRSLCGHQTLRGQAPTDNRFMVTGPSGTGRCVNLGADSCSDSGDCDSGEACIGGHCMPAGEATCSSSAQCATGAVCLGGKCRGAPSCIDDATCDGLFATGNYACLEKGTHWCRNSPGTSCSTDDQCPVCPTVFGSQPPCGRVCEPRAMKLYVSTAGAGGPPKVQLSDLFLDPDEKGLFGGKPGNMIYEISPTDGPYASTIQRLNCCLDDWWPELVSRYGTLCSGGCPSDLACND